MVTKYNGISNAGRVASYQVLYNSNMHSGQDPHIWPYAVDGARDQLYEHGEVITDQHFADKILKILPGEYVYVRNYSYNQCDFGLENVKRTLRNLCTDKLARSSSRGHSVVGRGIAMYAHGDSSGVRRFNSSTYGHCRNKFPQDNDTKKRGHGGGNFNGRTTVEVEATTVEERHEGSGGNNGGRGGRGGSTAGRGRGCRAKWCSFRTNSHSDN